FDQPAYACHLLAFPTRRSSDLGAKPQHKFPFHGAWSCFLRCFGCRGRPDTVYWKHRKAGGKDGCKENRRAHHGAQKSARPDAEGDRKSTRLNSSHVSISYAVFC